MKKVFYLLMICVLFSKSAYSQFTLNLTTPPSTATLFADGFISTFMNERDFAISPDGNEIYYTISTPQSGFQTIVCSKKQKDGKWSKPEVVSFAGHYSDLEPAFNSEGSVLYFASNRPLHGTTVKDFDIWKVERKGNGWSDAIHLGPVVNSNADEFYPSVSRSGSLYFTAQYGNGVGAEDIFVATYNAPNYERPVPLDTAINSKGYEFNAFVDPDEQYILFTGYGRKDDTGRGDLYMSIKDASGKWQKAKNLKALNSPKLDYCPYVSPDKKILFFTSERSGLPSVFIPDATYGEINKTYTNTLNGTGNIYWIGLTDAMNLIR